MKKRDLGLGGGRRKRELEAIYGFYKKKGLAIYIHVERENR